MGSSDQRGFSWVVALNSPEEVQRSPCGRGGVWPWNKEWHVQRSCGKRSVDELSRGQGRHRRWGEDDWEAAGGLGEWVGCQVQVVL